METKFQFEDTFINRRKKKILTLLKQGDTDEANGHLWMLGFNGKSLSEHDQNDILRFMQDINSEMNRSITGGMYATLPSTINIEYYKNVSNI